MAIRTKHNPVSFARLLLLPVTKSIKSINRGRRKEREINKPWINCLRGYA